VCEEIPKYKVEIEPRTSETYLTLSHFNNNCVIQFPKKLTLELFPTTYLGTVSIFKRYEREISRKLEYNVCHLRDFCEVRFPDLKYHVLKSS